MYRCRTITTTSLKARSKVSGTNSQPWRAYAAVSATHDPGVSTTPPPLDPAQKDVGGPLSNFFADCATSPPLPQRFADLKKSIFKEQLVQSWREVLDELAVKTEEVTARGADIIPKVEYADIERGLSEAQIEVIKDAGVVIVKGGVNQEEALGWKQSIQEYVRANAHLVKGTPKDNIVFYELYSTAAQLAARTHPALLRTQHALCALWHTSDPATRVALGTQMSYFDRLRIRPPGPSAFTLGCHIDGGSLERWEDAGFRACFARIFEGRWREHDPYDATPRIGAKQDLYNATNQCTVFRPWQGWTALSSTGAGEGTLRVLPFLRLSTAYIMLRPFFRPTAGTGADALSASGWEVNVDGPEFPGSEMAKGQSLSTETHPHLRLDCTMLSIPRVEPGDQVYWHCDLTHAVESEHIGKGDSSVLYIPAVPLTVQNATYLRKQLEHFKKGLPAPDFYLPGEDGEAHFTGRMSVDDVTTAAGRRVLGIEPFVIPEGPTATPGAVQTVEMANKILFD